MHDQYKHTVDHIRNTGKHTDSGGCLYAVLVDECGDQEHHQHCAKGQGRFSGTHQEQMLRLAGVGQKREIDPHVDRRRSQRIDAQRSPELSRHQHGTHKAFAYDGIGHVLRSIGRQHRPDDFE